MQQRAWRAQNRRSWNAVVPAHRSHQRDLAGFLGSGGRTTFPEERDLLGDIAGRSLLHLMCNSGADSLSLASYGAMVTGVDISDVAVAYARQLAIDSGIAATFECADVYDWLAAAGTTGQSFDRVYMGYGTICWLSDLAPWATGVAAVMRPGARFVLIDFHPGAMMFDQQWRLAHDYYAHGALLPIHGIDDYVGASGGGLTPGGFDPGVQDFRNPEPCYLFRWGLGEIVTALIEAGLRIVALREYPYSNGERQFANMREDAGRRMLPPPSVPSLPLMYGIAAEK